jgi:hypothetical protein
MCGEGWEAARGKRKECETMPATQQLARPFGQSSRKGPALLFTCSLALRSSLLFACLRLHKPPGVVGQLSATHAHTSPSLSTTRARAKQLHRTRREGTGGQVEREKGLSLSLSPTLPPSTHTHSLARIAAHTHTPLAPSRTALVCCCRLPAGVCWSLSLTHPLLNTHTHTRGTGERCHPPCLPPPIPTPIPSHLSRRKKEDTKESRAPFSFSSVFSTPPGCTPAGAPPPPGARPGRSTPRPAYSASPGKPRPPRRGRGGCCGRPSGP